MTDQHSESERLLYQDGYDDGVAAERALFTECCDLRQAAEKRCAEYERDLAEEFIHDVDQPIERRLSTANYWRTRHSNDAAAFGAHNQELWTQLREAQRVARVLEARLDLMTQDYTAAKADLHGADGRIAELEAERDRWKHLAEVRRALRLYTERNEAQRRCAELERELARVKAGRQGARDAASINLDERDEARRVARVLAEWMQDDTPELPRAAIDAALAYPEQKAAR